MNARTYSLAEPAVTDLFVCASSLAEHVQWLSQSLVSAGAVEGAPLEGAALSQRIGVLNPALVFIDFSGDCAAASTVVAAVRLSHPGVPVVALGSLAQPEGRSPRCAQVSAISSIFPRRPRRRSASRVCCSTTSASRRTATGRLPRCSARAPGWA